MAKGKNPNPDDKSDGFAVGNTDPKKRGRGGIDPKDVDPKGKEKGKGR